MIRADRGIENGEIARARNLKGTDSRDVIIYY